MSETRLCWSSTRTEFEIASTEDIIGLFEGAANSSEFNRARRVAETIVVKWEGLAAGREYANQRLAWVLFNGDRLRVPEPIRHVTGPTSWSPEESFIVMEHIDGVTLEEAHDETQADALVEAILHVQKQTQASLSERSRPGPPDGGLAQGFPWGLENTAEMHFITMQDLQFCANKRLSRYTSFRRLPWKDWELIVRSEDCTFCHLDLHPRNIILQHNKQLAILDWTTLALYPMSFEIASLTQIAYVSSPTLEPFFDRLISALRLSTGITEKETNKLDVVHRWSARFSL